jgi:hypothetical protein
MLSDLPISLEMTVIPLAAACFFASSTWAMPFSSSLWTIPTVFTEGKEAVTFFRDSGMFMCRVDPVNPGPETVMDSHPAASGMATAVNTSGIPALIILSLEYLVAGVPMVRTRSGLASAILEASLLMAKGPPPFFQFPAFFDVEVIDGASEVRFLSLLCRCSRAP